MQRFGGMAAFGMLGGRVAKRKTGKRWKSWGRGRRPIKVKSFQSLIFYFNDKVNAAKPFFFAVLIVDVEQAASVLLL